MKFPLTIIFLLITSFLFAQTNLVPNFSFEQPIQCPTQQGEIYFAVPWNSVLPCGGSDYFNSCDTGYFGVPANCNGYEPAHNGIGYAGIGVFIYTYTYRDYIQVRLTDTLVAGKKYYAELYVSLADSMYYACNDIGIYFSKDSIGNQIPCISLPYVPQIANSHSNALTNKTGWTKVSGLYIATGGEHFIVIGNFHDDATSDTVFVGGPPSIYERRVSYYYIDDVSVTLDTTTNINGIENNNYLLNIFPNPATNELTIDYALTDKSYFELYDVIGAKRKVVTLDCGSLTKRIDLTDIDSGLYFYSIVDKKGNRIKIGKLIVIK